MKNDQRPAIIPQRQAQGKDPAGPGSVRLEASGPVGTSPSFRDNRHDRYKRADSKSAHTLP